MFFHFQMKRKNRLKTGYRCNIIKSLSSGVRTQNGHDERRIALHHSCNDDSRTPLRPCDQAGSRRAAPFGDFSFLAGLLTILAISPRHTFKRRASIFHFFSAILSRTYRSVKPFFERKGLCFFVKSICCTEKKRKLRQTGRDPRKESLRNVKK